MLFSKNSYSQLGEDLVIINHLEWLGIPIDKGTYIDIGAFHPVIGSNTYKLYKMNWQGTVVDATRNSLKLFKKIRSRDDCINAAVVPSYYKNSTISFIEQQNEKGCCETNSIDYKSIKGDFFETEGKQAQIVVQVPTIKIEDILTKHVSKYGLPQVLDVDIEGLDLVIVMEIDFLKYPIPVVLVEFLAKDKGDKIRSIQESDLNKYMNKFGYSLQSICGPTLIYLLTN